MARSKVYHDPVVSNFKKLLCPVCGKNFESVEAENHTVHESMKVIVRCHGVMYCEHYTLDITDPELDHEDAKAKAFSEIFDQMLQKSEKLGATENERILTAKFLGDEGIREMFLDPRQIDVMDNAVFGNLAASLRTKIDAAMFEAAKRGTNIVYGNP